MSKAGERNNKKSGRLEAEVKPPAKYIVSVIGAAVSISGFVTLITTRSVKIWVKSHPYPIYLALIIAVLIIAGSLDYAYTLRKRITMPSDHDREFYNAALEKIAPYGDVITWLKRADTAEVGIADFPADVLEALEKTVEFSRTQSVGFDDKRLADSFEFLTDAIAAFCHSVETWTFTSYARQFGQTTALPPEAPSLGASHRHDPARTTDSDTEEETTALTPPHQGLVQAYDRFIRTAHARGIDIDRRPHAD